MSNEAADLRAVTPTPDEGDSLESAFRVGQKDVDETADESAEDLRSARLMGRALRRRQRRNASKLRVAEKLSAKGVISYRLTKTGGVSIR